MSNKIIRTICQFTDNPSAGDISKLNQLKNKFEQAGFIVQTIRICTNNHNFQQIRTNLNDSEIRLSIGSLTIEEAREILPSFHKSHNVNFNIEIAKETLNHEYVDLLFEIIQQNPGNTFNFTYVINGVPTPYFPSAIYRDNGFAIGLQSTDLAEGLDSLESWLNSMRDVWHEINSLMTDEQGYLGIDSSIAPLFSGKSSFVNFINKITGTFARSATTDFYTRITKFIKEQNPKPYGLNGLMLPCLEDFELAAEYSNGEFSIERNLFLSLHSGLGIDTYPIGINEDKGKVLEILQLTQALSNKYMKPLSVRFVSDGKSKVGEMTDFGNQYLRDVVICKL